jgi:hypothetical protein
MYDSIGLTKPTTAFSGNIYGNPYGYVNNMPINLKDPSGLMGVGFCLTHCGICEGTKLANCMAKATGPLGWAVCIAIYGGSTANCLRRCIFENKL